ncbi:MAG: circadian clock KaiB family protein [Candidatus Jettenia sp. CY-1]|nr:MAG: circadian clock KaiB family protein [Candidatus Jettenia sp. CY-1]
MSNHFFLRLYVTGLSKKSSKAIMDIKNFCEKYLEGRYKLEVIDIYQQLEFSMDEHVIVTPTLIKKLPLPLKKLIGDMSDTDLILTTLDIKPQKEKEYERKEGRKEGKQRIKIKG